MENYTLLTDLYQLTMIGGYVAKNKTHQTAVFDMFFRSVPLNGGFCVMAGLEQLVEYIRNIHFGQPEIDYLHSLGIFKDEYLDYLKTFRFSGDLYAVPEGTPVFPHTPLVVVKAPIPEAQMIETAMLNIINFQTLIATKACRVYLASEMGNVIEFGARRAHGPNGALSASRASVIGGCSGTSNVLAGQRYGIKAIGTHAHSWIMSFEDEYQSFKAYSEVYPDATLLLVDTYNTLESGVPNAIKVGLELEAKGHRFLGVRLDSGDLAYLAVETSERLDDAGLTGAKIVISNNLDEIVIKQVLNDIRTMSREKGIDGERIIKRLIYGVGTHLVTSHGASSLGGVYKLAAADLEGDLRAKIKISDNVSKTTNPGFKKLLRFYRDGDMDLDLMTLVDEKFKDFHKRRAYHPQFPYKNISLAEMDRYEELHRQIFRNGELVYKLPSLEEIQERLRSQLASMHITHKRITNPHTYKVSLSRNLSKLKERLIREQGFNNGIENGNGHA
jgi:nicotinate phosphoribosyltransferase